MFGLGPAELIIVAIIVLLIFGAKRIPEIGKGLGGAIRELKNVKKELGSNKTAESDSDEGTETDQNPTTSTVRNKVVDKVMEEVPGVKKAVDAKKKAEKVKELLK